MKNMKKSILIIALVIASVCTSVAQDFKFGHMNSQLLLQQMPEMEAVIKQLEEVKTSGNEQIKALQSVLEKQYTDYTAKAETLTPEQRQTEEQSMAEMQQKIQVFYQEQQKQLQQKEAELTQPVIAKARKVVEEVGKEMGFTYIFDLSKGEVLYFGEKSVDLMPVMRKKLGIAEPAATPVQ